MRRFAGPLASATALNASPARAQPPQVDSVLPSIEPNAPGMPRGPLLTTKAAWFAVAAIVVAAFIVRWRFLATTSPWPLGLDGFYYAVQMRSLVRDHQLYYPASPMVFWLLLPPVWALGPIAGVKFGAALGTALAAIPVYAIVTRATGQRVAGVLGAAILATAAGSFHLSVEFVKQGVGLTLALSFVATLGAALDAHSVRARRAWAVTAALFFIAALLSHLTSVGIAIVFGLPSIVVASLHDDATRRRRAVAIVAGGLVAVVAVIILVVPAARMRMGLEHLFGPASFDYTGEHTYHHEVIWALLAAVLLALSVWRQKRPEGISAPARALLFGPTMMALVLALPWLSVSDGQGLILRLRIMAFLPLAICAPAALTALLARGAPRLRSIVPLVATAMVIAFVPWHYKEGALEQSEGPMASAREIAQHTPENAIIIVNHRMLAFMVKWLADREARVTEPSPTETRPVYRYATIGVLPRNVEKELPAIEARWPASVPRVVRLVPDRRFKMWLFPEASWKALLAELSPEDRQRLDRWRDK